MPAIETLEKMARALEVPLYQLFYDGGEEPPNLPNIISRKAAADVGWGSSGKDARILSKFRRLLGRVDDKNMKLLMSMAQKMATRRDRRKPIAA